MISRSNSRREKIAATVASASLLVAVGIFFDNRIQSISGGKKEPIASESANAVSAAGQAEESNLLSAANSFAERSPPVASASEVGNPTATSIALPAAPTGDYELDLTPEQIGEIVEKRYGALLRTLALPVDRLARLRSLLIERQQATIDAANASVLVGLNPVREESEIRRAIELVQAPIDATLRSEFGETLFSVYQEYDRTLGERNAVADFSRSLATIGESLHPDQEKQLLQILKNTSPAPSAPTINYAIYGATDSHAPIGEKTVTAAARILSPRQLAQFRKLQQP